MREKTSRPFHVVWNDTNSPSSETNQMEIYSVITSYKTKTEERTAKERIMQESIEKKKWTKGRRLSNREGFPIIHTAFPLFLQVLDVVIIMMVHCHQKTLSSESIC